jgi:hypothetical protein
VEPIVKVYDPDIEPDAQGWLKLDEQQRIDLAQQYHRSIAARSPNAKAHAVFHVVVENQIAGGLEPVQRAMKRLTNEGLSRHEAVHAIGAVLAEHLNELMRSNDNAFAESAQARYNAAVERLTVKEWHRKYGAK